MLPLSKPKILVFDLETLPHIGFSWQKWQTNMLAFTQEGCIATFAAKWLGEKEVIVKGLPDYKGYKPWSYDDKALVVELHKLVDEADVTIAHHGDQFDTKVFNSRCIFHKLPPPSPVKTIDTKKIAKRVGRFVSNKLDDLGESLGEGRKIRTDFDLWRGCIEGDLAAWKKMKAYNAQDVLLLERVYLRLRPWDKHHPNHGIYNADAVCPKCGSANVQFRGYSCTQTRRYRRFQCECGGWGRQAAGHSGAEHTNA